MTTRVGFVGLASYPSEDAAGGGFNLDALGAVAGPLLAKDVAIFADHSEVIDSPLLAAALPRSAQMGKAPLMEGANSGH